MNEQAKPEAEQKELFAIVDSTKGDIVIVTDEAKPAS